MGHVTIRQYTPLALPLTLALLLGACSHMPAPSPVPAPVALKDANGNPIPPRPQVFGRHAWDLQYGDAARQAQARTEAQPPAPAPVAQPAPPTVVAMAPPPPPPPVMQAPPPPPPAQVVQAPASQPALVPQAPPPVVQPTPAPMIAVAPPPPPPVVQTPPPPVEAAVAPPPPAPVPAPKPAAPAQKGLLAILKDLRQPAPPPVAGGYQTATNTKAVRDAADFAVHQAVFYDLKSIYSAKIQVVAGTNYSLCLWVRQKEHEANPLHRRMVAATVFQGLDGHYELSSWQEVNVCRAGS